jgi:glutamyl endopeptidase
LHNEGGWARKIEVIPGANGMFRPYGSEFSSSFRSVKGWVNSKKPEHDYGCIVLPANAFGERNPGYFGISAAPPLKILGKRVSLYGYPGDKPSQNWGMTLAVKTITAKTLIYDIDTVGGQSGAPVYTDLDGRKNCAIAIHNYGSAGGNSATRITPTVFERLSKWALL